MEQEKVEVRIVAGTLRGRKIPAVVHEDLRPTPQRVRESLFSILGNAVPGRTFFDVFAGTGVIGLEAISRGAKQVIFLEKDARLLEAIEKCMKRFDVMQLGRTLRTDVYRYWERWRPIDDEPVTVFFSPPFPHLAERLDEFISMVNAVAEKAPVDTVVAVQAEDGFDEAKLTAGREWDVRKYGRNLLMFWVKEETPPGTADETEPK